MDIDMKLYAVEVRFTCAKEEAKHWRWLLNSWADDLVGAKLQDRLDELCPGLGDELEPIFEKIEPLRFKPYRKSVKGQTVSFVVFDPWYVKLLMECMQKFVRHLPDKEAVVERFVVD